MSQDQFEKDCERKVKSIAEELERRYNGNDDEIKELEDQLEELENNEPEVPDEDDFASEKEYDAAYESYEKAFEEWKEECDELQEKIDEAKEEGDLRSYFDDYLDVDYIVNSSKEYQSARIWITLGGPGICVDTERGCVHLTWGGTKTDAYISYDVRDAIDEIFSEIYNW